MILDILEIIIRARYKVLTAYLQELDDSPIINYKISLFILIYIFIKKC